MWYDFLSIESQGCLVIFGYSLTNKFGTFLMWFTQCCDASCIFGKFDGCLDLFPYISRGVRTRSLYMASPCMNSWPGRFVTICITRWSNTEMERVKILAVDIDDYFDPKIIIFDQVFIACLMSFLLEIIFGHLIIFPSHFICSFAEEKRRGLPRESWVLLYFSGLYLYSGEWCSHGVL